MERLIPGTLTSSPNETYLQGLKSVSRPCLEYRIVLINFQTVEYITSTGAYAIVDPHNYGR